MIRALFEQVATPSKLGPLGLVEVLDWTAAVLNRVDRATFLERFNELYAVQNGIKLCWHFLIQEALP
jgi:hypothetical protein